MGQLSAWEGFSSEGWERVQGVGVLLADRWEEVLVGGTLRVRGQAVLPGAGVPCGQTGAPGISH